MKRLLLIPASFVFGWAVGYTAGMHSGALYVRDAWKRAAERSTP